MTTLRFPHPARRRRRIPDRTVRRLAHRVTRRMGRWWRHARPGGEAGQALVIVLGVIGMVTAGTVALAQNALQHQTMVSKASLQHESFQALQAGINEYLSAANTNPDFVTCTHANENSGFCANALQFDTWTPVPGVSPTDGPPAWYWLADPVIDTSTATVSIKVVGASGFPSGYAYQEGSLTLSALNDFLLNVLYIDYDQIDPLILDPTATSSNPGPTCGLYGATTAVNEWTGATYAKTANSLGPSSSCAPVNFITGDTLNGNVWIKDAVFVCGSPAFKVLHTQYSAQTIPGPGCSDSATTAPGSTYGSATPDETLPTTDGSLASLAKSGGCLFEGPTDIVLNGTQMSVYSPDTPVANGKDGDLSSRNPNACVPNAPNTDQTLPANGVIYVENCTAGNTTCTASGAYNPMNGLGETGSSGPTEGDALVQGTLTSPLTIATDNNVIVDGDICYTGSGSGCATAPSSYAMLGLIAQNFVEINRPMTETCTYSYHGTCYQYSYSDVGYCSSTAPTVVGSSTVPNCDLQNPVVDAVSLSLTHSFLVNNYQYGSYDGTLTAFGTVDEDWRGPVGTSSGSSVVTGYLKDYVYDPRLAYLSPPYYLNPGTSSWGIGTITIQSTLDCPLSGCGAP